MIKFKWPGFSPFSVVLRATETLIDLTIPLVLEITILVLKYIVLPAFAMRFLHQACTENKFPESHVSGKILCLMSRELERNVCEGVTETPWPDFYLPSDTLTPEMVAFFLEGVVLTLLRCIRSFVCRFSFGLSVPF